MSCLTYIYGVFTWDNVITSMSDSYLRCHLYNDGCCLFYSFNLSMSVCSWFWILEAVVCWARHQSWRHCWGVCNWRDRQKGCVLLSGDPFKPGLPHCHFLLPIVEETEHFSHYNFWFVFPLWSLLAKTIFSTRWHSCVTHFKTSGASLCTGWWWALHPPSSSPGPGAKGDSLHSQLTLCKPVQPREHLPLWARRRCWEQLG